MSTPVSNDPHRQQFLTDMGDKSSTRISTIVSQVLPKGSQNYKCEDSKFTLSYPAPQTFTTSDPKAGPIIITLKKDITGSLKKGKVEFTDDSIQYNAPKALVVGVSGSLKGLAEKDKENIEVNGGIFKTATIPFMTIIRKAADYPLEKVVEKREDSKDSKQ